MSRDKSKKTISIIGPTASGKSDLAIALAKKINGDIISADARQIYRHMNIGSGKILRDKNNRDKIFYSEKIRHYMLDIVSPRTEFNIVKFITKAKKNILEIKKNNHIPIICGGTHFWIQALLEDQKFPHVKPDKNLRAKLTKQSTEKLYNDLKKYDKKRAMTLDKNNRVHIIRAIEICKILGSVPEIKKTKINQKQNLIIAIDIHREQLHKNIERRLELRLKQNMLDETFFLHFNKKITWKRLEQFGLEYKYTSLFLQKKITYEEMKTRIISESKKYAKRQQTWVRRWEKQGTKIHHITSLDEALKITREFLEDK